MAVPERCACGVHGSNGFHLLDCPDHPHNLKAEVERLREAEAVLEALVATTDLRNAPQAIKDRIGEVIRAKHAR